MAPCPGAGYGEVPGGALRAVVLPLGGTWEPQRGPEIRILRRFPVILMSRRAWEPLPQGPVEGLRRLRAARGSES